MIFLAARHPALARAGLFAGMLLLAGCGGDRLTTGAVGGPQPVAAAPSGRVTSAPLGTPAAGRGAAPAAAADMAGRWLLASGDGRRCGMNFGAVGSAGEGSIAPEGGCPGKFFTSRRWAFDQGALVIRDHTGAQLAQLAAAGSGHFEGTSEDGQHITLAR